MVWWGFLPSTRCGNFVNGTPLTPEERRCLYLNKLLWAKLCRANRAAALLRDFGVHPAMIQVFYELPLRDQISWLEQNIIPRKGFPCWSGEKIRWFEQDSAQPVSRKWMPLLEELERTPYKEVREWTLKHGNEAEFLWVGSSRTPALVYFKL